MDIDRNKFNISGTEIRNDLSKNWDLLPDESKVHMKKRIIFMGPESVGKSTMSKQLSYFFGCNDVIEWGRAHTMNKKITFDGISEIGSSQLKLEEDEALISTNGILFCDTDLITTKTWSKLYFNDYPKWFDYSIPKSINKDDLFLLMTPEADQVLIFFDNFISRLRMYFPFFVFS